MKKILIPLLLILIGCADRSKVAEKNMNRIAEEYVKLVLEVGLYEPYYVDAFYGPENLKPDESQKEDKLPYKKLSGKAHELIASIEAIVDEGISNELQKRKKFLITQLTSVSARIDYLNGKEFTFDEESKAFYDAVAPTYSAEHFDKILLKLENVLPGKGDLQSRFAEYREEFIIPAEKLDTVFQAAIKECRKKILKHIKLPENENFKVEYVENKPWGAYNWYKGNAFSLIQFNKDITPTIERAVDLACHEGYPGHHVFNALLETKLYEEKGWVEYSVYPLYSPQSLIAEGTANFGIEVTFPGDERIKFEKEVLFPLAGIDPEKADEYYKVLEMIGELNFAGNEAARNYLDEKFTEEEAIEWMMKYLLMTRERAAKRIDFINANRSYVINYNLGQKLVREYIEKQGGTADNPELRWKLYTELLSTPMTPSELK